MRHIPLVILALSSAAFAKSGDTLAVTVTLAGHGTARATLLEMNGALHVQAEELAPALIAAGWLDRAYLRRFKDGLVPANQIGGHHFVRLAEFSRGFGLTVTFDAARNTLTISKAPRIPADRGSSTVGPAKDAK